MNLTNKEFEVLVYLERHCNKHTILTRIFKDHIIQKSELYGALKKLIEIGFILDHQSFYKVTEIGYNFLNKYKVKRAIFIAAGFGSRMVPATLVKPKPLITVNGIRMIDTLIDAVLDAGITEIIIVRGYLKEQFDTLLLKYPMLKFIDNDKFSEGNNIISANLVADLYESAYVLDADLLLSNHNLIRKYEYQSSYIGYKVNQTSDWRLCLSDNQITGMKKGGSDCYQMVGISFWTHEAGCQFRKDIEKVLSKPIGKEYYWDDVILTKFNQNYKVYLRQCRATDVIEIDTYKELMEQDFSYK